jgi:diguanylate cyclase (GGDEF)-like protein
MSIERAREGAYPLVVCILDLDDFKAVNDLFGHAAGDILLREIALRMKASLRAEDYIARLGGDEFVLILENLEPNEDLIIFLDRFRELIEMPVSLPTGENVSIGLSLGLTIYSEGETDPDLLMRQADEALYLAKATKGSRSSWWKIYSMAP